MTTKRFTWPFGIGDKVLLRVRKWYQLFDNKEVGTPVNPRRIPSPDGDPNKDITYTNRWRHIIGFTLNELRWLSSTLDAENPDTAVAKAIRKAYQNHTKYVEQNSGFTGEWEQKYDFTEDEIRYLFKVLNAIKYGRPTPSQLQKQSEDIEQGDW